MPYVNIKVTREDVTTEQKRILIQETTEMLVRVLSKDPQSTHIVIDEIDTDNWGFGGESVTRHRSSDANGAASVRLRPELDQESNQ